jgi:hypothetical protein
MHTVIFALTLFEFAAGSVTMFSNVTPLSMQLNRKNGTFTSLMGGTWKH